MKQTHGQTTASFTATDGKTMRLSKKDVAVISAMLRVDKKFRDVIQVLCVELLKMEQQKAAAKAGA
jgi:hypothetical protein